MAATASLSESSQASQQSTLSSGVVVHKWRVDTPRAIVIVQHGFGEYAERYARSHSELIPKLNENGFEVWAMDLWGHGSSPGSRGMVHVGRALQDHIQLRQQATAQKLPLLLLGHSLGGLVTAGSVTKDPFGVDGVVLCSPALPEETQANSMVLGSALGLLAYFMPTSQVPKARTPADQLVRSPDQVRLIEADGKLFKGQTSFLLVATALQTAKEIWKELDQ